MNIDHNAPLSEKKEIIINAPISDVWKIQTDIDNWPLWQKDISMARLNGKLQKGTTFVWKAMGLRIVSMLQHVEEQKTIGWSGDSLGMHAVHFWRFEKQGNNTKVITEESLSGWLPSILKLFNPNFLEHSLSKTLLTLKQSSEIGECKE